MFYNRVTIDLTTHDTMDSPPLDVDLPGINALLKA